MVYQTKIDITLADGISFEEKHRRTDSHQNYVFDNTKLEGNFSHWKGLQNRLMVENFSLEKGPTINIEHRYYICSIQTGHFAFSYGNSQHLCFRRSIGASRLASRLARFNFHRLEEALNTSVVPAVSFSTHTLLYIMSSYKLSIFL